MGAEMSPQDAINKSEVVLKVSLLFAVFLSIRIVPSATALADWKLANGPNGKEVRVFAFIDAKVFAGTTDGAYVSTDNGNNWTAFNAGLADPDPMHAPIYRINTLAVIDTFIFAGTDLGGVFRSSWSGSTWISCSSGLTNGWVYSLLFKDSFLFAGTNGGGVFRSTDRGSFLFAATYGGVFRSTDSGTSWSRADSGISRILMTSFAVRGTSIFAGSLGFGIFVSTDNGGSWTARNAGLTETDVRALSVSGNNIFAGTSAGGVFLSTNSGTSWTAVNSGLRVPYVYALASSTTHLFAGNLSGVWRRPLSEMITAVEEDLPQSPTGFSLGQNYPNPFNPTTVVRYQVPAPSGVEVPVVNSVRLVVYDVLGREVAMLVNERQGAGVHEVMFDGSGLASGVYAYRLTAGRYVESRKMLLLK